MEPDKSSLPPHPAANATSTTREADSASHPFRSCQARMESILITQTPDQNDSPFREVEVCAERENLSGVVAKDGV